MIAFSDVTREVEAEAARALGYLRAVVLDMMMPGMNGRATFAAMREVRPGIPVVLMSGHTMNEEIQSVLDAGASGFLTKPYSVEMLARSFADAIRG